MEAERPILRKLCGPNLEYLPGMLLDQFFNLVCACLLGFLLYFEGNTVLGLCFRVIIENMFFQSGYGNNL